MALDLTAYGDGTTNCTIDHILLMGRDTCSMPGQIVRMRGSIQERMQRCRGKMGRSIKGLRGVQSGQSEGEVLDWTLELAWGGGTCMHPHPCFAACLPRKRQEAARQQQQQHPLVASNSGLSAAVPAVEPTTVTVVDRLKHQLLQAYDNGDTEQATDVIIKLEKSNLTKELLEMTRVGAVVNDIRKKIAQSAPELSKQCRTLIKCWQKLAEPGPTSSGSSSTNGTPSYASPVVRRGLTPGTPSIGVRAISGENSRLTAVGNACLTPLDSSVLTPPESSDSRSTVPSTVPNGRAVTLYQRSRYERAANTAEPRNIQKSHTVGADLAMKAVENSLLSSGEIIRNGKRKGENTATSDIGESMHAMSSATVSPAIPHQSLLAARRADVKSTSELVAQLTENLPGYLAINISQSQVITRNEHDDNEGQANVDISQTLRTPVFFTLQPETSKKKEKRNYVKKDKDKEKGGQIKDRSVTDEKITDNEKATTSTVSNRESIPICSTANSNSSASKMVVPTRNGKYDWYAMLPSLETLRSREHFRSKPSSSQRKSYIMNVLGREVLALPYIDVGLPDFLEYQYPRPERFYAEENFIYGAPRPN
ncbi:Mediator of RNA polymerase II transcription subunit [Dirofilaria immitis]